MVWIYHMTLFIHLSVCRHLGYFHILVVKNNASINIHVQVPVWMYVFISSGYISMSRIVQSHSKSIFNYLRNCQMVFQSSCIILHPYQQCMKLLIFLHLHQYLVDFLIISPGGCEMASHCNFDLHFLHN